MNGCRRWSLRLECLTSRSVCSRAILCDRTFKVHLDGYNLLPYLTGQEAKTPRPGFFYFSDDGDLMALRFDNWKVVFAQQRSPGTLALWGEPFVNTRIPWLYDLRTDPFEPATITSNTYWDWYMDHAFIIMPTQTIVQDFLRPLRTTHHDRRPRASRSIRSCSR